MGLLLLMLGVLPQLPRRPASEYVIGPLQYPSVEKIIVCACSDFGFLSIKPIVMGKKRKQLSHEEIWDDSALVDSWNAALQEYQVTCYDSTAATTH